MKNFITFLIALIFLTSCQISTIGTNELYKSINFNDPKFYAGFATSPIVHELGHVVMLEAKNLDYYFKNTEIHFKPENMDDIRWVSRAGFLTQLGTGYLIDQSKINKQFKIGYKLGSAFMITTYPLRGGMNYGDLEYLSNEEWAIYSGLAVGVNLIEIKW